MPRPPRTRRPMRGASSRTRSTSRCGTNRRSRSRRLAEAPGSWPGAALTALVRQCLLDLVDRVLRRDLVVRVREHLAGQAVDRTHDVVRGGTPGTAGRGRTVVGEVERLAEANG